MIVIDGSSGEGGGQNLRSSLSLAAITKRPLKIINIRAKRSNPGLQNQHLCCCFAAASVSGGRLEGAVLGSTELVFTFPSIESVAAASSASSSSSSITKNYSFDIGSAGSSCLVTQTVIPIALFQHFFSQQQENNDDNDNGNNYNNDKSVYQFNICGGTHNGLSPSTTFITETFFPVLHQIFGNNIMNPATQLKTEKIGMYPAGGGKIRVTAHPLKILTETNNNSNNNNSSSENKKEEEKSTTSSSNNSSNSSSSSKGEKISFQEVCLFHNNNNNNITNKTKIESWNVELMHTRVGEKRSRNSHSQQDLDAIIQNLTANFSEIFGATTTTENTASVAAAAASSSTSSKAKNQKSELPQEAKISIIQPKIVAKEVHALGRGLFISQKLEFSSTSAREENKNLPMILSSMEKKSEQMCLHASEQAKHYLSAFQHEIFVEEYLADQLLLPLSLYSYVMNRNNKEEKNKNNNNNNNNTKKFGFKYYASCLSLHSATNIVTIENWLGEGSFHVFSISGEDKKKKNEIDCKKIVYAENPKEMLPGFVPVVIEICC